MLRRIFHLSFWFPQFFLQEIEKEAVKLLGFSGEGGGHCGELLIRMRASRPHKEFPKIQNHKSPYFLLHKFF